MSVKKYALDPGADQIRLCGPDGTIYTQASYIAVRNKGETIAAGDEAAALFEKASPDIRVCRPFRHSKAAGFVPAAQDVDKVNRLPEG